MNSCEFYLIICLSYLCLYSRANDSMVSFLGYQLSSQRWMDISNVLSCWIDTGAWALNESHIVIDDFKSFAPCGNFHKPRSPCAWILDGNMTRYYWKESSSCHHLKLLSTSPDTKIDLSLKPFDGRTMCELMKSRGNIMVAGDSVSTNAIDSWRTLWHRNMKTKCSSDSIIADCYNLEMIHGRNDRVSIRTADYVNITENMKEHLWADKLIPKNISLLVLNRGAHYEADHKLLSDLKATMDYLVLHHPNVSIIWRSTPHGHLNYRNRFFSPPLTEPPSLPLEHGYNYAKFKHQNTLVKELLAHSYPQVLHLDAYTPTILRMDSHPDPTHICPVGGHIETWFILIYNILLVLRSLAEVK
jgi:inhibitor of KinA sporulation pathway (predicted exonuclease)